MINLHTHTEYSMRDGAAKVTELFKIAKENGQKAIAITDHGNQACMFDAMKYATKMQSDEFVKAMIAFGVSEEDANKEAKAFGAFGKLEDASNEKLQALAKKYPEAAKSAIANSVKFIPGVEMYFQGDNDEDSRYHLILLAKDWEGQKALNKICNLAQLNKYGDHPRTTMESLRRFIGPNTDGHGHVVGTSACMQGQLSAVLLEPFRLNEKIQDLKDKINALPYVRPSDTLIRSAQRMEDAKLEYEELNSELRELKPLAAKKVKTRLTNMQNKVQKLKSAGKPCEAEEAALEELIKLDAAVDDAVRRVETLKDQVDSAKKEYAAEKERHLNLEKEMGPQLKLQQKIDELQDRIDNLSDPYEAAKKYAMEYAEIFGEGNWYIELQNHGIGGELYCLPLLRKLAKELNLPMTIANDIHFAKKEDFHKRSLLAAMQPAAMGQEIPIVDVENHQGNRELYFKTEDELRKLFPDDDEAFANTEKIAEMCNVFYHKEMHLPTYEDVKGRTPDRYLYESCREGFRKRYPDYKSWPKEKAKLYGDRIKYELGIINKMGYDSYIAIVRDFIFYARNNYGRALVGPGRGSGAGSLVNYLLEITDIDPMKYDLVFERFLNPERVSMPDIDSDFAPSIRGKVIDYVTERYAYKGEYVDELKGTVVYIATAGTLAARAAIKSAARSLYGKAALDLADMLSKKVPATPGITINDALASTPDLNQLYKTDPKVKRIIDDAKLIEGYPVNFGVHAAGVIISDKPVTEYCPMFYNDKKSCWTIQYDKVAAEDTLGFLKMDFLGLKNLDIFNDAKNFAEKLNGIDVSIDDLQKADDARTFKRIYAQGDTDGVFQFESGGMKRILRNFVPNSIDDVILLNAAYRPGPMDSIPRLTDVKHGRADPNYIIPEMEKILGNTYGAAIYQEQIMTLFQMVGFSAGQADIIRRAMSKKHLDELEAAKDQFVAGMLKKNADPQKVEEFWTSLLEFAKYAFNKSHSAAYSVVSYYTAWMKCHYPAEYISALMSYSPKEKYALYINDAMELGAETKAPDINKGQTGFAPVFEGDRKVILFGLENVMGVASNAAAIVSEREEHGEYGSYAEFIARASIASIKKSAIEPLIKVGAFDSLHKNRKACVSALEDMYDEARKVVKKLITKNPDANWDEQYEVALAAAEKTFSYYGDVLDYQQDEKLAFEKQLIGCYLSGHPLNGYEKAENALTVSELATSPNDPLDVVNLLCYIDNKKIINRKSDGKAMAKFTLGDKTGEIDSVCFVNDFARLSSFIEDGNVVLACGKIKIELDDEGELQSRTLMVRDLKRAEKKS